MDYENISRVPDGYWKSRENRILFRDYLATKLQFECDNQSHWYCVKTKDIRKYGGNGLLNSIYKGRTINFLKDVFSEWNWNMWLFKEPLKKFWKDIPTQKNYLIWLANKLQWKELRDFYKLTTTILKENNGTGLLVYYDSSPLKIVTSIIGNPPEGDDEWYPWVFDGSTPNGYWSSTENQQKYAKWLFKRLGFTKMEDWYGVSQETFRDNFGSGIILSKHYNSSHIAFLQNIYKDYVFYPWLFRQTPQGYWKNHENRILLGQWLCKQLNISSAEDWYTISRNTLRAFNCGGLLAHYYNDSYIKMIIDINPQYALDEYKFNGHITERRLERFFKENNISYEKQYSVCKGKRNGTFKVDFLLPELNIIVELDGAQHFRQVMEWLDPRIQIKRDVFKMQLMAEEGYRCIRLLQEEVITCNDEWLNVNLIPYLKLSESTIPIYVATHQTNVTMYDAHKELYGTSNLSVDDLYDV